MTADCTIMDLQLVPTHAFFRALIAEGRLLSNSALDLLPEAALDALLGMNIIALHPDGAYTVHARHVESFLRRKLSDPAPHSSDYPRPAPPATLPSLVKATDGMHRKATARRGVERAASPEESEDEGGESAAEF